MTKKTTFNAKAQFRKLLKTISDLRPGVSIKFYCNLIMDLYGKAAPIDWSDWDQNRDAEAAIQCNIMEPDEPHAYLWHGETLKRVAAAVKALENFLEREEAAAFVIDSKMAGSTMETDDLEFWVENLA